MRPPLSLPGPAACTSGRVPLATSPRRRLAVPRAAPADDGPRRGPNSARTSTSSPAPGGLDPALEFAVPVDQRPVNELAALRTGPLYSWATLPTTALAARLALSAAAAAALLAGPIAAGSFDPATQPLEWALASGVGAGAVATALAARVAGGWSYVGKRLLSAAIPYEETGWYDGQTFVKPPEVLARDRLLGTYEVRPALARLKGALVACGTATAACALGLAALTAASPPEAPAPTARMAPGGTVLYSPSVSDPAVLASDDAAAAAEAAAQAGIPGFCGDRVAAAAAGGVARAACDRLLAPGPAGAAARAAAAADAASLTGRPAPGRAVAADPDAAAAMEAFHSGGVAALDDE